jgi:hypothetical protein
VSSQPPDLFSLDPTDVHNDPTIGLLHSFLLFFPIQLISYARYRFFIAILYAESILELKSRIRLKIRKNLTIGSAPSTRRIGACSICRDEFTCVFILFISELDLCALLIRSGTLRRARGGCQD